MGMISQTTILGACWLLACSTVMVNAADTKTAPGDWPSYNHDMASTRYSPLTQINAKNVAALQSAWTFSLSTVVGRVKLRVKLPYWRSTRR